MSCPDAWSSSAGKEYGSPSKTRAVYNAEGLRALLACRREEDGLACERAAFFIIYRRRRAAAPGVCRSSICFASDFLFGHSKRGTETVKPAAARKLLCGWNGLLMGIFRGVCALLCASLRFGIARCV